MIDEKIIILFNKYYVALKRDNPDNTAAAMQAAASMAQTHILKESLTYLIPQPQTVPPSYTDELQTLNANFKDLNNKFEDAKMGVVRACDDLIKAINLH